MTIFQFLLIVIVMIALRPNEGTCQLIYRLLLFVFFAL